MPGKALNPRWITFILLISPILVEIPLANRAVAIPTAETVSPNLPASQPIQAIPGTLDQMPVDRAVGKGQIRGDQIRLNGKVFPAPWSLRWQTDTQNQFAIHDAALSQITGIQFLNTNAATQQPIQWFSTAGSMILPAGIAGSDRSLTIADFAQRLGWQVTTSANMLNLVTPAAKLRAVRQGNLLVGDRIVIELDRPATWHTNPQTQEIVLTVDAQADQALVQSFKAVPGTYVQSIQVEPDHRQTRLRVATSADLQPRVWSLTAPDRIVMDLRPDSLVEQNILWAPGIRWRQQYLASGSSRAPVVWLEVNLRQPGLRLKPILPNPNSMQGIAPLAQIAQLNQAAAAINGGFFHRSRQLPLGAIRQDGRWLSGPILNRGAIAWDDTGNLQMARLTLRETVVTSTGQRFPVTHLNSGYLQAGIARYTPAWGTTYTPLSNDEVIISMEENQVVNQQLIPKAGSAAIAIPAHGYLLVLRSNQAAAAAFSPGVMLQLESLIQPADFNHYPNILAAGPLLLLNRQIVLDAKAESFSNAFITEAAPRSAIAQTADGTLLLVTVHRRLDGTDLTLTDIAQLLLQMGAVTALNLDGGSSTTLFLGGQILNRPPQSAARVHNGIGVFLAPTP